jgi:antitoxin FitA
VKTIQIRNVPDATHATLRTRAAAAGVSLSDYALAPFSAVGEGMVCLLWPGRLDSE